MSEHRRSNRYAVQLEVSVKTSDQTLNATSSNMSLGGIALELSARLPLGSQATLSFRVPGHSQPIEVDAEVRWSTEHETGFQFGGLRAREVWELSRYFASLPR